MTRERWERIKELHARVQELPESEQRAFLDTACEGSDDLRREVESILRALDSASPLFDTPALESFGFEGDVAQLLPLRKRMRSLVTSCTHEP